MQIKVAFLIIAHKDFDYLLNLISHLSHPQTAIYIHIDIKSEFNFDDFERKIGIGTNVYFLKRRVNINWGGFSMIEATLHLLEVASKHDLYDYFYLLSGQDYPIKHVEYILKYLEDNNGKEFLDFFEIPNEQKWSGSGGRDRYEYFWLIDELGLQASKKFVEIQRREGIKRSFPLGLTPYGGSNWFTLTRKCVHFIIDYLLANEEVLLFFKYSLIADEILFLTIILNSQFKNTVVNNNLRYIDWASGPEYPRILTIADLSSIVNSECHFARKFDAKVDCRILSEIDHIILSS